MRTREADIVRGKELQPGFLGFDNRFTASVIGELLTHFKNPVEVTKLVQDNKLWSEVPKGNSAVVDLFEPTNRQFYLLDPHGNVIEKYTFNRSVKARQLSMAVVLIPALGIMGGQFLRKDLEPIVDSLSSKGGGLIVAERLPSGLKPDRKLREKTLSRVSHDLNKPSFITTYDSLCLWTTRRPIPNDRWQANQKRKRALTDKLEGVGRHVVETSDGSGLNIIDITPKGIAVSQVGEPDGLGKRVSFESMVVVPPIGSRQEQNLSYALAGSEGRKALDDAKGFIPKERMDGRSFLIDANCPSGAHAGKPQPLTRAFTVLKTLKNGRIQVSQDTVCGHCNYHPESKTLTLKPTTRVVEGKTIQGWVNFWNK